MQASLDHSVRTINTIHTVSNTENLHRNLPTVLFRTWQYFSFKHKNRAKIFVALIFSHQRMSLGGSC